MRRSFGLTVLAALLLSWPTPAAPQPDEKSKTVVDALGDPLPVGAVARLGTKRLRHNGQVSWLAFSPDAKWLASAASDSWLKVWEADTGKEVFAVSTQGFPLFHLTFSPNGKVLAVTSRASFFKVFEVPSGKLLWQDSAQNFALAWSADGKQLALGRADGIVKVVEGDSGKIVFECARQNQTRFAAVAFVRDGKEILTVSEDYSVCRFETGSGRLVDTQTLPREIPRSYPPALALTPDGKHLALAENNRGVWHWKVGTEKAQRLSAKEVPAGCYSVSLSADGRFVAVGHSDGSAVVWGCESGRPLRAFSGSRDAPRLAVSGDGRRLASASAEDRTIRLWDLADGRSLAPAAVAGDFTHATFMADGCTIVTASNFGLLTAWEFPGGKRKHSYTPPNTNYLGLGIAPDGKTVRALDAQQRIISWDPGKPDQVLPKSNLFAPLPYPMAFSPDGTLRASRGPNDPNTVVIRDGVTNAEIKVLSPGGPGFALTSLFFAPDGRWLAGIENNRMCRVWEIETGRALPSLGPFPQNVPTAFSPDGRYIVNVAPTSIHLWEVASGRERLRVQRPVGLVRSIAVSWDNRLIMLGSNTGELIAYDTSDGTELRKVAAHTGGIRSMTLSPDGRHLVTLSDDGTGLVWDVHRFLPAARPRVEAKPEQVTAWVNALSELDPAKAAVAVRGLSEAPEPALAALKEKLKPLGEPAAKRIAALIEQLDDNRFKVRDAAMKELARLGVEAKGALEQAIKKAPSEDARSRIETLLKGIQIGAVAVDVLRELRLIETLERMGTPAARDLLAKMAEGKDDSAAVREAKIVLKRWTKD